MIRMSGGQFRGQKIKTPEGDTTRPASDRVRQAVFNMLMPYALPQDAIVVDGFCGSGSYGLEALSRGAEYCHFIENKNNVANLCLENAAHLKVKDHCDVYIKDITRLSRNPDTKKAANLIFLDPPYGKSLLPHAIDSLIEGIWCKQKCIFVLEMEKSESFTHGDLQILKEKTYGVSKIVIAERA